MTQRFPIIRSFGTVENRDVREILLRSADGAMEANIIEIGAALRDLKVRRSDGSMQRVVLGLNSAQDYRNHSPHMGANAGRFGNRIGAGRFVLDGVAYQLPLNENGRTALHGGGVTGFGKSLWALLHADAASVVLGLHDPAGHNGYPGAMTVTCRYSLVPPATLRIEFWATTDAATVINLCHHSYFNLDGSADVLDHQLQVYADLYAPIDADLIPDGTLSPVDGTHLDFRAARRLGGGAHVDNTFILKCDISERSAEWGIPMFHAATLGSAKSGLTMQCWSTEPALQVYDGFKLNVAVAGLDSATYGACAGIALEPQHVPNSPNHPHFPSTVLRPGDLYRQVTEFRF